MLGTNTMKSLLFPKLRFEKTVNIKGFGWEKDTVVYTLDWTRCDQQKEKLFNNWKFEHHPDVNVWYVNTLPEPYDTLVKNFQFIIDGKYLREINRNSHNAFYEWNLQRSFDTVIREICLKPAISYTEVAFKLVADCLYDPNTNYYERNDTLNLIASKLLLYKFWAHQTGRGLLWERAEFDKLDDIRINIGNKTDKQYKKETYDELEKFHNIFKKHEEEFDNSIKNIYNKIEEK